MLQDVWCPQRNAWERGASTCAAARTGGPPRAPRTAISPPPPCPSSPSRHAPRLQALLRAGGQQVSGEAALRRVHQRLRSGVTARRHTAASKCHGQQGCLVARQQACSRCRHGPTDGVAATGWAARSWHAPGGAGPPRAWCWRRCRWSRARRRHRGRRSCCPKSRWSRGRCPQSRGRGRPRRAAARWRHTSSATPWGPLQRLA
jgi:hypothetical protein